MTNQWIPVESTCLKEVRYHTPQRWLDVKLSTGRSYRYTNVSFVEYHTLITADSVGKEFNNIKLRHEGEVTELHDII